MQAAQHNARGIPYLFLTIAFAVYGTALLLGPAVEKEPEAAAFFLGLTLDLIVIVPGAFYLFVVRRRGLSPWRVVPVLVLSVLAAARILPEDHQQPLRVVELALVPLEIALVAWIGWRASKALRGVRLDAPLDPLVEFQRASRELVGNDRVAGIVASEIAVFYYALGSWRAHSHIPSGSVAVYQHEKSGQGGLVLGVLVLMLIEVPAVHLLVHQWSAVWAWILTATTLYTAIWLVADYRATVLRPLLIDERNLVLRAGLRVTATVPRSGIAGIGTEEPSRSDRKQSLTLLSAPTHWIAFKEPVEVSGPYGTTRCISYAGTEPDDAATLFRVLPDAPGP